MFICSTAVPPECKFTGLLTPNLYGLFEMGQPLLWTGGAAWPAHLKKLDKDCLLHSCVDTRTPLYGKGLCTDPIGFFLIILVSILSDNRCFRSSSAHSPGDQVIAVVGLDLTMKYFYKLLVDQMPACRSLGVRYLWILVSAVSYK